MKSLGEYLQEARKKHFAVPQFNVSVLEEIKAAALAAKECQSPVIIGLSEGERKFMDPFVAKAVVEILGEKAGIPFFVNADHTHSVSLIGEALGAGFSMVHFDGSALPYNDNLKQTKVSVEMARQHNKNIVAEGELGYLRGGSSLHGRVQIQPEDLTDPKQAKEFVEKTGINLLAVAVGNIHGIDVETGTRDQLDIERIEKISKMAAVPLVLHGGSDVSEEQIKNAIKAGVCKININTALRMVYTETLRSVLTGSKEITIYKFMDPVVEALKKIMIEKINTFGSGGKI